MDNNFNEKISLDDLFTRKEENQRNTIKIFQKILARAHKKIKTVIYTIYFLMEKVKDSINVFCLKDINIHLKELKVSKIMAAIFYKNGRDN